MLRKARKFIVVNKQGKFLFTFSIPLQLATGLQSWSGTTGSVVFIHYAQHRNIEKTSYYPWKKKSRIHLMFYGIIQIYKINKTKDKYFRKIFLKVKFKFFLNSERACYLFFKFTFINIYTRRGSLFWKFIAFLK